MFAQSFSRISKAYRYLLIIQDRYAAANAKFMDNTLAMQKTTKEGKHPVTTEQAALLEEGWKLNLAVELEIDSFYIFSKMLLDRIAHGLEFYFGQANGCSLEPHKEMTKCFSAYVKAKGLTAPPDRLMELLEIMTKDIRDYRDHEIVHVKKPRALEGIGFDSSGNTFKAQGILYPTEKDKFVNSKTIDELMALLDEYIGLMIGYIEENASRTKLELLTVSAVRPSDSQAE